MKDGIAEKIRSVKLLILDVDGVMTDGSIVYDNDGGELKTFNVMDGHGIKLLMKASIRLALITARSSRAVLRRAEELGITLVYQGTRDKLSAFKEILEETSLEAGQTAYMGDEIIDIPVLKRAGLSITVPDAASEVRERVDYITEKKGGRGAVREVAELILKEQGKWEGVIKDFLE